MLSKSLSLLPDSKCELGMTAIARILKLETQRNPKSENRGEERCLLLIWYCFSWRRLWPLDPETSGNWAESGHLFHSHHPGPAHSMTPVDRIGWAQASVLLTWKEQKDTPCLGCGYQIWPEVRRSAGHETGASTPAREPVIPLRFGFMELPFCAKLHWLEVIQR